ncbi:16S rRNA (uracil(1498)-N(3))-methyltransferase [Desulfopila sp. IMCC35008]|uniref:16S rRNA (uracil(1498)-N(3))-methyltransferase n=1 Tax=Desulfopila sp. IMCC35008 TaxID=2653858 RepID=UPI0013D05515|nr:16S rRNA (uracil(1498)-N(3))-methyltransferase [Desulfopila sp. IMCC35008]
MNIILADQDEIENGRVVLEGERADHIVKVLRAKENDTVRFGVLDGEKGRGTIVSIKNKHPRMVELKVELTEPLGPLPRIDLVVAMARPIMIRRILSQATALGVGTFHIIHANRVEKSFWEASMLEQESFYDYLIQGLEQSVDTRMPEVIFHRRFKPFVEDVIPTIADQYSHMLLGHPGGEYSLAESIEGQAERILLAVGPEGGWVDYEVEKFRDARFMPFTIGSRILKVDTAVVALHARISQICGE